MRRLVAFVLLVAFLLQSSGSAALAATPGGNGPSLLASARGFLGTTLLGAVFTGTLSRYAAMHDTRPDFTAVHRHRAVDVSRIRTSAFVAGRPASGQRLVFPAGFAEMRPPSRAAAQAAQTARAAHARIAAHLQMLPAPTRITSAPTARSTRAAAVRSQMVDTTTPATTGINRYWTYTEGAIPGAGKYMVNVANGNVLVEGDDIDIPERGIDLTFRRVYNSQSLHDWHAGDGSTVGNYGGGWTNTFDSHLGYDPGRGVISWYDIDGARYDYSCSGTVCTPPTGQHATMTYDGGCGYWITKKSGTAYHFWAPTFNTTITPSCFTQGPEPFGGVLGRVVTIWGRNHNNNLQFTYSFDNGDASSPSHLAQILVQHSDGQSLTLNFGDVNGQRVLLSILRPDGQYVRYGYDDAIELSDVCLPGNGNTDGSPTASSVCGDTSHLHHRYGYNGGPNVHQIAWADSPRWTMSWGTSQANGFVSFSYDTSGRLTTAATEGIFNFTPDDGTGVVLQSSAATGTQQLVAVNYGYEADLTSVVDTDGHSTEYSYDSLGREVERQAWNGSEWLTTTDAWDAQDNLIATTDARGQETDYAYDGNGNTIAVAQPAPTVGGSRPTALYSYDANGNVTAYCDPLETQAIGHDWDATGRPAANDGLCPSVPGAVRYTWATSTNEPFGFLTDSYSADYGFGDSHAPGSHQVYAYSTSAQGGDFGLPTSVTGDSVNQADGTTVTPKQQFVYGTNGTLVCYSKLQDTAGTHWWRLTYDTLNRITAAADPDDASTSNAACPNTPGIAGSHIVTSTTYFPDGQPQTVQTPSQYKYGLSEPFGYDPDGNVVTDTHYFGWTAGTTTKWYDGADRLVEVQKPTNGSGDLWVWLTRYCYDLTSGGLVGIDGGPSGHAGGNLFKTQQWLPGKYVMETSGAIYPVDQSTSRSAAAARADASPSPMPSAHVVTLPLPPGSMRLPASLNITKLTRPSTNARTASTRVQTAQDLDVGAGTWYDVSGQAFDPLDRKVADYRYLPGSDVVTTRSHTYDANGFEGLPTGELTPVGDTKTYLYDGDGRQTQVTFGVSSASTYTPGRSTTYDQDGRVIGVGNPEFGTWSYTYSRDGQQESESEPTAGGTGLPGLPYTNSGRLTDAATITRTFASGGSLALTQIVGGAFNHSEADSYRADGARQTMTFPFADPLHYQYTAAGRSAGRTDALGADTTSYDAYGRIAQIAVPDEQVGYPDYDPEGEPTSLTIISPPTIPITYTATGEITGGDPSDPSPSYYLDGVKLAYDGHPVGPEECGESSHPIIDTRNGMIVATVVGDTTVSDAYDADGRVTTTYAPTVADNCEILQSIAKMYRYDAEDHTTFVVDDSKWISDLERYFSWGPNGHPVTEGQCLNDNSGSCTGSLYWHAMSLHWDGDFLQAETRSDGAIVDFKLGMDGDLTPTSQYAGVTYWDRDASGGVMASQRTTGASGVSMQWTQMHALLTMDPYAGEILAYNRTDGVSDGTVTLQGVRNYSQETQQWTTPDAYTGDVSDPGSQLKYVWNGNNAIAYDDPTGYNITWQSQEGHTVKEAQDAWNTIKGIYARDKVISAQLAYLEDPKSPTIIIEASDGPSQFAAPAMGSTATPQLQINLNIGYQVDTQDGSGFISAATSFVHEAGHAYDWASDPAAFYNRLGTPDAQYDNKEERFVITGVELRAVTDFGESIRINHAGTPCPVVSVLASGCKP